jgi:DNA-binding NtrC family response regulator
MVRQTERYQVNGQKELRQRPQVILVVDDDPAVKDLTREMLELCGHKVLTAETLDEALILCHRWGKQISLVFLDMSSPQMTTEPVFEKIFRINPCAKVIVTSIYSHDWNPEDVFGQGAAGFLKKPFRMTELLGMVEKVQEVH